MNPSQAESDAMAAFLANREGSLEERARQWAAIVELLKDSSKVGKENPSDSKS